RRETSPQRHRDSERSFRSRLVNALVALSLPSVFLVAGRNGNAEEEEGEFTTEGTEDTEGWRSFLGARLRVHVLSSSLGLSIAFEWGEEEEWEAEETGTGNGNGNWNGETLYASSRAQKKAGVNPAFV
ncbi:MAG: hypothetical protein AAF488_06965, partial [Planctomycetota bacterium]